MPIAEFRKAVRDSRVFAVEAMDGDSPIAATYQPAKQAWEATFPGQAYPGEAPATAAPRGNGAPAQPFYKRPLVWIGALAVLGVGAFAFSRRK
jgi:hypothetical protein